MGMSYAPHADWIAICVERCEVFAELLAAWESVNIDDLSDGSRIGCLPPLVGLLNFPALPRPPGAMFVCGL